MSNVARIKPGEIVWLLDKVGKQHRARVEEVGIEKTRLLILETKQRHRSGVRITLAQVMLKAKKMDLIIQKATELGSYAFQPIISERAVVKLHDGQDKKMNRWERITIEAAKQSGSAHLPKILPPMSLREFITREEKAQKYFLCERGGKYLRDILISPLIEEKKAPGSVILLVGPEGGWTDEEEQAIMENRYEAVSLGSLTLRSETAAIVGLAMVSHFWNDEHVS